MAGLTWTIPPGTEFQGYNITARSQPSFLPILKDRASTYVDFHTRLRTGVVTQFQYYVDTGPLETVPSSGVYVRFQLWEVLDTSFASGVPTNYSVQLKYELRHLVDTVDGVYTVRTVFYLYAKHRTA